MIRKKIFIMIFLASIVSCNSGMADQVEVTRIIKETVEVTRLVNGSPSSIPQITTSAPPLQTLPTLVTPEITKVSLDYDAVMIVTQFYILSGHGQYDEAYKLFSSSHQNIISLNDYVENGKSMKILSISLFSIQPLYEWALHEGLNVNKDPDGIRRFIVWLTAFGERGIAGAAPNGTIQKQIITLILEKGEWKICSIGTIPTINPVDCK